MFKSSVHWFKSFVNLNMKTKLIVLFLLVGITPLAFGAWMTYRGADSALQESQNKSAEALKTQAFSQLVSLRSAKKQQVEHFFKSSKNDLSMLVENVKSLRYEAIGRLQTVQTFKKTQIEQFLSGMRHDTQTLADNENVLELFNHLKLYHDKMETKADGTYDTSTDEFKQIAKEYGGLLRYFVEELHYSDAYMICAAHGHVMYSATEGADLGSNCAHGPYKEESLAHIWRQVVKTDDVVLQDFEPYSPNGGVELAFMGAPIHDHSGKQIGVVVLQINSDPIDAIVQERQGLGTTGETFLVGLNNQPRPEAEVLGRPVRTGRTRREGPAGAVSGYSC